MARMFGTMICKSLAGNGFPLRAIQMLMKFLIKVLAFLHEYSMPSDSRSYHHSISILISRAIKSRSLPFNIQLISNQESTRVEIEKSGLFGRLGHDCILGAPHM